MADMSLMKNYVGGRVYSGVEKSSIRGAESGMSLTRAFPLNLARDSGEELILEIWCSSYGPSIAEEMRSRRSDYYWVA